jgi:hypothetical protein
MEEADWQEQVASHDLEEVELEPSAPAAMLRRDHPPPVLLFGIVGFEVNLCYDCMGRTRRHLHGTSGPLRMVWEEELHEVYLWTCGIWEAGQGVEEVEFHAEHSREVRAVAELSEDLMASEKVVHLLCCLRLDLNHERELLTHPCAWHQRQCPYRSHRRTQLSLHHCQLQLDAWVRLVERPCSPLSISD